MLDKRKFYINGAWVDPRVASAIEVLNPATEAPIAMISMGSTADVDIAIAAAKRAFFSYSQTSVAERLAMLELLLTIHTRRYEEMAATITAELGAPITMSREQQADVRVGHLQGFIDALKALHMRQTLPNGDVVLHEPVGVCGLITPWNWPINQIALKPNRVEGGASTGHRLHLRAEAVRIYILVGDAVCRNGAGGWLSGRRVQRDQR